MKKKPFIIANWKMNLDRGDIDRFFKAFDLQDDAVRSAQVGFAPSTVFIEYVHSLVSEAGVQVIGQNIYHEDRGAFTGEVSARQLADAGCDYVLIGHSERRKYFGETDEQVNTKVHAALQRRLKPIVCFGESYAEKEAGDTKRVIIDKVHASLADVRASDVRKVALAYEPLWAISTSTEVEHPVADTPESAQVVHKLIRKTVAELYDNRVAEEMMVLYGGSVDGDNSGGFAAMDDIDGALVGGASKEAKSFQKTVTSFVESF